MRHGLFLLYQGFSVCMYCLAVMLLIYLSYNIHQLESGVKRNMYQQHVISCKVIES